MRIVQFVQSDGARVVAIVSDDGQYLQVVESDGYVRSLVLDAYRGGLSLADFLAARNTGETVSYDDVEADNRLLTPLDHPDPAHCLLSGTGLDHLGSAQARDAMHAKLDAGADTLTDSMRMFQLGLEGGKPTTGEIGVQPEWFYKGDGDWLVPPGHPLASPSFALDGGDEPELVGLYVIGDGGEVLRVGYAIGNEFSDHIMERQNYLYLAHSKLRNSSFGPELLVGPAPKRITGTVRILREGEEIYKDTFLTGEDNMTHSLANIEHHHFKYSGFRRPGDVHCHFFGTATLSFAAGITAQPGDVFEVSAEAFGRPLRNPLRADGERDALTQLTDL